ncbi:MAG: hypothetical protein B5M52_02745 [Helicobacteraceae bacterium 4484_230]|nr:MAG: hypothetical protein B5M52_02745 [Helicobacteraceae bacterium 4484_230]
MLSRILEAFYPKVFIGISVTHAHTEIAVAVSKGSKLLSRSVKRFESIVVDDAIAGFIGEASQISPLFYTALICDVEKQGVLPSCALHQIAKFVEPGLVEQLCFNNHWLVYAYKEELYRRLEDYRYVGLDFMFSPFMLLAHLYRDEIKGEHALYILSDETSLSIAAYDRSELCFGSYMKVPIPKKTNEDEDDELYEIFMKEQEADIDDVAERLKLVEHALLLYYSDDRYHGKFVQKVYLADSKKNSEQFAQTLEEALFADIELKKIDVAMQVARLSAAEAGYDI